MCDVYASVSDREVAELRNRIEPMEEEGAVGELEEEEEEGAVDVVVSDSEEELEVLTWPD